MATKDDPTLLALRRIYKSLNEIRISSDLTSKNRHRIFAAMQEVDQIIWRLE